jgi:hypothetical protein
MLNCFVNPVVKVDERVRGPDALLELLTRYQLAWLFQENLKDLKWLFLEPDSAAVLAKASRILVQFEVPEPDDGP